MRYQVEITFGTFWVSGHESQARLPFIDYHLSTTAGWTTWQT